MTREQAILRFLDELGGLNMHGFLLSLDGETLAEGYWSPFEADRPHRMYSVSKSVVSLAIGMLMDEGRVSLDDPIVSYFPEYDVPESNELLREVTLRHMLTMSTCYDRAMYSPLRDREWTRPFFQGVPSHVPGTVFSYDTSASQVMCALVEKLAGRDILSFMQERLFDPLHMRGEKRWLRDGMGVSQGGTGLIMTLRDFSRLANFCMSDGRGLISEGYLRAATGRQISTMERPAPEERHGYGYQFWRTRHGFSMYGLGGQMGICIPEKKLCLCTTADLILDSTGVQPIYDAFFRWLEDVDTLQSDPADAALLEERLNALACAPVEGWMGGSERQWVLRNGALAFDAVAIGPEAVRLRVQGKTWTLPYAPGRWIRAAFPVLGEECLVSGGWQTEDRFVLHCELIGDNACGLKLYAACRDRRATVRVTGSLWECAAGWNGTDWGREEAWI